MNTDQVMGPLYQTTGAEHLVVEIASRAILVPVI